MLKSLDTDFKKVAIEELVKKFSSDWSGRFSSYEKLHCLITSEFIEKSNKVISSVLKTDFPIHPCTSVYIRLLSPPSIFSGFTPVEYESFPRKSSFVSYQKYFNLITKNSDTLDKMQWRVLTECSTKVPLQEALIEKLSPIHTGYLNIVDDIVIGSRTVARDRYRSNEHKKMLLRQMPELQKDEKHLFFLMKQGYPTLENEMHDKAIGTLPPLYVLCNSHWTNPKYSFGSIKKASILDAYYWNEKKDERLVMSLNSMDKQDIETYLSVAFSYCNSSTEDAIKAVSWAWRALTPLHSRLSATVSSSFKKIVRTDLSSVSEDKDRSVQQSVTDLSLLRKGLYQYTSGSMTVPPDRMAEYQARVEYNLSVKEKQKNAREEKQKFLDEYTKFLQVCLDKGIPATKELFQSYKRGNDISCSQTESKKDVSTKESTEDLIKRKLKNG